MHFLSFKFKILNCKRGEIATTLTLISIGVMVLGSVVGVAAVRGPLKNLLRAQTPPSCDRENPQHLCGGDLTVRAFVKKQGGACSRTSVESNDTYITSINERGAKKAKVAFTKFDQTTEEKRLTSHGTVKFQNFDYVPSNYYQDEAVAVYHYPERVNIGGVETGIRPCANQKGVDDLINRTFTRNLTRSDFKSSDSFYWEVRFEKVQIQPTATPTISPTPTKPPPPEDLTASCAVETIDDVEKAVARFSWTKVEGANRYAIRVDADPDSFSGNCNNLNDGDFCDNNIEADTYCSGTTCEYSWEDGQVGQNYSWWLHSIIWWDDGTEDGYEQWSNEAAGPEFECLAESVTCPFRSLAYVRSESSSTSYLNINPSDTDWGVANDRWRQNNSKDEPRSRFTNGRFLNEQNNPFTHNGKTIDGYAKGDKASVKLYYDSNSWELVDNEVKTCEIDGESCENAGVAQGSTASSTGLVEIPNLPIDCNVDMEYGWVMRRKQPAGKTRQLDWLAHNSGICWTAWVHDSGNGQCNLPDLTHQVPLTIDGIAFDCLGQNHQVTLTNKSNERGTAATLPAEVLSWKKDDCDFCSQSPDGKAVCQLDSEATQFNSGIGPGCFVTLTENGPGAVTCTGQPPPGGGGGGTPTCIWCTNRDYCWERSGGTYSFHDDPDQGTGGWCGVPGDGLCCAPGTQPPAGEQPTNAPAPPACNTTHGCVTAANCQASVSGNCASGTVCCIVPRPGAPAPPQCSTNYGCVAANFCQTAISGSCPSGQLCCIVLKPAGTTNVRVNLTVNNPHPDYVVSVIAVKTTNNSRTTCFVAKGSLSGYCPNLENGVNYQIFAEINHLGTITSTPAQTVDPQTTGTVPITVNNPAAPPAGQPTTRAHCVAAGGRCAEYCIIDLETPIGRCNDNPINLRICCKPISSFQEADLNNDGQVNLAGDWLLAQQEFGNIVQSAAGPVEIDARVISIILGNLGVQVF